MDIDAKTEKQTVLDRLTRQKSEARPHENPECTFMPFRAVSFIKSTYKDMNHFQKNLDSPKKKETKYFNEFRHTDTEITLKFPK